jgi:twinfilin-like protein
MTAKTLLPPSTLASRKVETSDPKEIDEAFMKAELGLESGTGTPVGGAEEKKSFSRPKGPARTR